MTSELVTESWRRERGKFITEIQLLKNSLRRSRSLTQAWRMKYQHSDSRWKRHLVHCHKEELS